MTFEGPHLDDYQNVVSLNLVYLQVLRRQGLTSKGRQPLPLEIAERVAALTDDQLRRLSEAPFLLVAFREHDVQYWDELLATESRCDLFAAKIEDDMRGVVTASIAFIWQLARQNPYALRLICGSTLYWSERIAEQNLVQLVDIVGMNSELSELRNARDLFMWRKLLIDGVSENRTIRHATHMSALQTVLTRQVNVERTSWSRAARSMHGTGNPLAPRTTGGVA